MTLWGVQEFKVWKGINPVVPMWHSLNLVSHVYDDAEGLMEYLERNAPDRILRVAKEQL